MANRVPWTQRRFSFEFPAELFPEFIERLRGTPARVEELVWEVYASRAGSGILTRREREGTWSIQENIGHLTDLEGLFVGRLDDYDAGLEALRAADMTNKGTHEAGHNGRTIEQVVQAFRRTRAGTVRRLEGMAPEAFARVARHPRLGVPMRLTDMLYFQAAHDDYHLARMRELLRMFGEARGRLGAGSMADV